MMSSTRGVLVTGEETCKQISSRGRTIERTRRRVSSAMFVSFGISLGGAVGPIEDGTDVFAGQCELAALHMHDGPDGRHDLYMWSMRPAKTCVRRIEGISQSGRRRSGLARLASARWSISRCLCRLSFNFSFISTCTYLVAQLHLEYTWSTHNRQRHLPT